MSERELFPTDHNEYISVKLILNKNIVVYTFEDYERLEKILENMFFTRYSSLTKVELQSECLHPHAFSNRVAKTLRLQQST